MNIESIVLSDTVPKELKEVFLKWLPEQTDIQEDQYDTAWYIWKESWKEMTKYRIQSVWKELKSK